MCWVGASVSAALCFRRVDVASLLLSTPCWRMARWGVLCIFHGLFLKTFSKCVHVSISFPEANFSRYLYNQLGQIASWLDPSVFVSKAGVQEWVKLLKLSFRKFPYNIYQIPLSTPAAYFMLSWGLKVLLLTLPNLFLDSGMWLWRWEIRKELRHFPWEVISSLTGSTFLILVCTSMHADPTAWQQPFPTNLALYIGWFF